MVRRLPLSSSFYTVNSAKETPPPSPPTPTATSQAWMWPSCCKHPRTQQLFRSPSTPAAKTVSSAFLDSAESSSFTNSSTRMHHHDYASDSLSSESEASGGVAEDTTDDAIVHGLRSDRLRFEPRESSSSILEKKPPAPVRGHEAAVSTFGSGVPVAFESADPYQDFRVSMQEMITAHGAACDWDWLEKMLGWYLRANGKDTHAAIVASFVDLVSAMNSSFTLSGSKLERSSSSQRQPQCPSFGQR